MATSELSMNRITGLATGLDTESLVKQLMKSERVPLDKLTQKKQTLEWTRDAYRDVTNLLRGFQDEFFNILKSSSNMTSKTAFYKYNAAVSDTDIVSVTANADAKAGAHTLKVTQLAEAANATGNSATAPLVGSGAADFDFTDGNNKFNITVDGVTKTISLRTDSAYADYSDLVDNAAYGLQKLVDDAFGTGKVNVSVDGVTGQLTFASTTGKNKITLTSGATKDALADLKFTSGVSNRLTKNETLDNLATRFKNNLTFDNDQLKFTINGKQFTFSKSTTLKNMMDTVNNSDAGVELTYSELNDTFKIVSKQKGAGDNIVISNQAGNFFQNDAATSASGIAAGVINNGKDAIFELDGVSNITRSDNNVTIDGVTYTFKEADASKTVNINITQSVDDVYNNIKTFVDKYNDLIDKINGELGEKKDRSFLPLTDEQKEDMSEDEITKWENKAKTGLLRNDSILQSVVRDMRRALFDTISGVSGTLKGIGITTGTYEEKGKLIIDENKLKEAIAKQPDKVTDFFAKTSDIGYSPDLSRSDRNKRYQEEGVAQRLYDIIRDNIRTTRDKSGNKGILVEKAGFVGDASEFTNWIDKEIGKTNTRISEMTKKLDNKETYYYNKFAALEEAISKLNQQSSWLTQQFSSNS